MFKRKLTHIEIAQTELEEARQSLLVAMNQSEYYSAMVEYHKKRVDRLENYTVADDGRVPQTLAMRHD